MKKLLRSDEEKLVTGEEYERRLREQFVKLHGTAQWAEQPVVADDRDSSDEAEDSLPATSARRTAAVGGPLRPEQIDVERLREVEIVPGTKTGPSVIRAMQFHPNSELFLTGGLDKTLRLFAVDGDENPKVSSHFFNRFPITGATFSPTGDEVLLTGLGFEMWSLDVRTGKPLEIRALSARGNKKYFGLSVGPNPQDSPGLKSSKMYTMLGDAGSVMLCDVQTKFTIKTFQMNAPGVAAVFSPERDTLFTVDEECGLYEWDLGSGRCRQRFRDKWATDISVLAVSRATPRSPTPLLAVGTASGNIDFLDVGGPKISSTPVKTLGNLTTRVSSMQFHGGGELLAAASREKKDQLKLVHTSTGTVFSNWPTVKTPLHTVTALDFSRRGGLMAIGNERGRVLIYRVAHLAEAERAAEQRAG